MTERPKADLLLIDGRHLLYRVADAFRSLEAVVEGESIPTGGLYGFLNIALRVHNIYGGKVVVAWEGDRRNFRFDLYPEYKNKREPLDDDKAEFIHEMATQEYWLKEILTAMGVRQYLGVNCEADDVIGSLATKVSKNGKRVMIYSGDSDLRSLVKEADPWGLSTMEGGIYTISPGQRRNPDKVYGPAEVFEKHGVTPEQLAELKALAGDTSDNIPGVKGVGPKTAAALIHHYGTLKKVQKAAMKDAADWPVAARFKASITDARANIKVYHKLTTIDTECSMARIAPAKRQKDVVDLLKLFKFRSMAGPVELHGLMRMG